MSLECKFKFGFLEVIRESNDLFINGNKNRIHSFVKSSIRSKNLIKENCWYLSINEKQVFSTSQKCIFLLRLYHSIPFKS